MLTTPRRRDLCRPLRMISTPNNNNNNIKTHKLLNPPLLNPPSWTPECAAWRPSGTRGWCTPRRTWVPIICKQIHNICIYIYIYIYIHNNNNNIYTYQCIINSNDTMARPSLICMLTCVVTHVSIKAVIVCSRGRPLFVLGSARLWVWLNQDPYLQGVKSPPRLG